MTNIPYAKHQHGSFMNDKPMAVHIFEHMLDVKEHSRLTAINMMERERAYLVDTAWKFLPHDDLDQYTDEVADSIQWVDEILAQLMRD